MAPFFVYTFLHAAAEQRCRGLANNTFLARAITRVLVSIAEISEQLTD
jgi:hypothetical protein